MPKPLVVDTNVFVSALKSTKGASRAVIAACLQGHYQPLRSNALLVEYEDLMAREALFANCLLDAAERNKLLNAFLRVCRWKHIYYIWRPNLTDEADNHLIELAIAGGAEYLVTYNRRDFQNAQWRFPQLQIIEPKQLFQEN